MKITDGNMGYDLNKPDALSLFPGSATGEVVTDAWGGWHDAGDWDRRTPHLETVRKMVELWEFSPEYQEMVHLSIPEGGDDIPDVLNEAMWSLDLFRWLQADDGGVGGGVESASHPNYGDGSWGESLTLYAYAADAWTTWEYAAAAAKMAGALERYDSSAAAEWRDSALRAMNWAENNIPAGEAYDIAHVNSRNLAAAELYRLTGDAEWNTLYQATTVYSRDLGDVQWFEHQFEAAFVYARTDLVDVNAMIRDTGVADMNREAGFLTTTGDRGGFGSTINPYAPYGWGSSATAAEEASDLFLRLHALTGDASWLAEAMSDMQYLLGANPLNMSFLTGLGGREPLRILNVDAETMGAGPPPGITIYGDNNIFDGGFDWFHGVMQDDVWPTFYQTPVAESFQAFETFVAAVEYTVMQGMQDTMFVTGYLAAQGLADAQRGTPAADSLIGGAGDNVILADGGNDTVNASAGDDGISAGDGADLVFGKDGNDSVFGNAGDDRVFGGRGADVILGGAGADIAMGGLGDDVLIGGSGDDKLKGNDGDDTVLGSDGNDMLRGGSGNDILGGEAGNDRLTSGIGGDIFIFRIGDGADRIMDFEHGIDEIRIDTLPDVNLATLLSSGSFSADSLSFTLDLGAGDRLTIQATVAITTAQLTAAIDLI
jgi:endoglucanase